MVIEPRSITLIREELTNLHEAIKLNKQFVEVYPEDPVLKMGLNGYFDRQNEIMEEIIEYNHQMNLSCLDIKIDGAEVTNNEITVSHLCEFLNTFQDLIDDLGYISTQGIPPETGSLPLNLRAKTALVFQGMATSSFKIILASNSPDVADSHIKPSLKLFNEIVAAGNNEEQLKTINKKVGTRTINKYKELLDVVKKHKSEVVFFDKIRFDDLQPVTINRDTAKKVVTALEKKGQAKPPQELIYPGTIKVVDHIKQIIKFEIGGDHLIEAKFNTDLVDAINSHILIESVAKFRVTDEIISAIEQTKYYYELIELIDE